MSTLMKAEAIVVIRDHSEDPWRPCLEIDPIMLPLDDSRRIADTFDPGLIGLVSALSDVLFGMDRRLVWSADYRSVWGTCSGCDGIFVVTEGMPGTDDITCGCGGTSDPR
jgi:hypothetical protein